MAIDANAYYTTQNLDDIHRCLNHDTAIDRIILREGLELAIDPSCRMSYQVFCLDPALTRELDNSLRVSRNRRRLLDIGALHGRFSMSFTARAGREAIAVEPSPLALPGLHVEIHRPWLTMFDGSTDVVFRLLMGCGYRIYLMDGQEVDGADLERLRSLMFHVYCTHRSTAWTDRLRGCV
jgi:hypothetical protein